MAKSSIKEMFGRNSLQLVGAVLTGVGCGLFCSSLLAGILCAAISSGMILLSDFLRQRYQATSVMSDRLTLGADGSIDVEFSSFTEEQQKLSNESLSKQRKRDGRIYLAFSILVLICGVIPAVSNSGFQNASEYSFLFCAVSVIGATLISLYDCMHPKRK